MEELTCKMGLTGTYRDIKMGLRHSETSSASSCKERPDEACVGRNLS